MRNQPIWPSHRGVVLLLAALLAACGSSGGGSQQANVIVTVPSSGWLSTKAGDPKIYQTSGGVESVWVGRGVNLDDIFLCGYNYGLWMSTADSEQALLGLVTGLLRDWKPTLVRVSLSMNSYSPTVSWLSSPAQYRDPMIAVVNALVASPGVYVLVTVRTDASMTCADEATCIPTAGTDAVYQGLVDTFGTMPSVLFGLSNEPGGNTSSDAALVAAMTHAVGVIRAREDANGVPHHLVSVQGNDWTSRLDFYAAAPLSAANVVYEYHGYPPTSTGTAGYTYANLPVIIGEHGSFVPGTEAAFFADVEAKQISNVAWDFEPYSDCAPDLLQVNQSSTLLLPTAWGTVVQNYLKAH
jgi:hypothetical protein